MTEISIVKEFCVGMHLLYDGVQCKITEFPTRTSVVLEALDPVYAKWWTAKTTIRELREDQKCKNEPDKQEHFDKSTLDGKNSHPGMKRR